MNVENVVHKNIAVESYNMNQAGKRLSPDLPFQMTLLPPLTIWIAQRVAGRGTTKGIS